MSIGGRSLALARAHVGRPARAPGAAVLAAGAGGSTSVGLMATASARSPSTSRGPGRETRVSSIGRIAPVFTAVMTAHHGRALTWAAVVP